MTLALAAAVFRRRVSRSAAGAVGAMTGGLAVFLFAGDPRGGNREPGLASWVLLLVPSAVLLGGLAVVALRTHGARRAALLAVTAGGGFGLTAVLMKGAAQHLQSGPLSLFTSWAACQLSLLQRTRAGAITSTRRVLLAGSDRRGWSKRHAACGETRFSTR